HGRWRWRGSCMQSWRRAMTWLLKTFTAAVLIQTMVQPIPSLAQSTEETEQLKMPPMYVISDLHFGVGRAGGESFHPMEDFRWPHAFDGFLRKVSADHPDGAKIVIAGDFLELWQHPTVACAKLKYTECGCTIAEMRDILRDVLDAHPGEFTSI